MNNTIIRMVSFVAVWLLFSCFIFWVCTKAVSDTELHRYNKEERGGMEKHDSDWKKTLSSEQYRVIREKGTERPFSGEYWNNFEEGIYKCAACGEILFKSDAKFDAGCGWPSFYEAVDKSKIEEKEDLSLGMRRIEVTCRKCGGHLGHLFPDGPKPTGMRYCINSVSIKFEKKK